mmetsp:Transcript_34083/g.81244  ORF Transcript_34083/g.81244 Transcript_34083/m.81244 type:complete len:246 (+) Transcript_34083:132-869(+)
MGSLKLALLGASGQTGLLVMEQAIEKGYHVTAVVRDFRKANLPPSHNLLSVVVADVFDHASLAPHLKGKDAVMSALGFPKPAPGAAVQTTDDFTRAMAAIITAMGAAGVTRLVSISAWYTDKATRAGQLLYEGMWSKVPGLPAVLDNTAEMEVLIQQRAAEANLNFTTVRVPTLTLDESTGRDILASFDKNWADGASDFMPRADVARYMVSCIEDKDTYGKHVAVGVTYSEEETLAVAQRLFAPR